jgi:exonuclease VII large subunit
MAVKVFDGEDEKTDDDQQKESSLPEQLQGKSPDEMYEMLKQEHERVVNKLKAEKFDQKTETPPAQPQQQPARQAPSYPPPSPQGGRGEGTRVGYGGAGEAEPDIYTDPEGFMDRQLQRRLQPLIQTQTQALRSTNQQMFQQSVGEEYEKYKDELEQFVDALHPQLQVDPRAYKQAYNYVRSLHLDEIVEEKSKSKATESLATALADAGLDEEQIATVVQRASGNTGGSVREAAPDSSLFQSNTGIPRTASSNTKRQETDVPSGRAKGRYSPRERQMMEEFGMSPKEWDEYRAANTDMISGILGE